MTDDKSDTLGPSGGGERDWLAGRDGLSRESLTRAEAAVNGTDRDGVVTRLRALAGVLVDRVRDGFGADPGSSDAASGGYTAEADGGTTRMGAGPDGHAGTADRSGRVSPAAARVDVEEESAFNWGGTDDGGGRAG